MKFETEKDLSRETKAIDRFIQLFSGKAEKLGKWDLDYKVYDHPITVGAGGSHQANGNPSTFSTITSAAGGYGGRIPRQGSANDLEMMIYYEKQDKLQTHLYQWL